MDGNGSIYAPLARLTAVLASVLPHVAVLSQALNRSNGGRMYEKRWGLSWDGMEGVGREYRELEPCIVSDVSLG